MIVGADVGGTFTDLVAVDQDRGTIATAKTLTTPDDPSQGILAGIHELMGANIRPIDALVHGTTLVVNALIERKGAATGLVTTEGFRDILELGQETRYDIYDLGMRRPEPLVARRHRLPIRERIDATGQVLRELDLDDAVDAIRPLVEGGIESLAVCFIHAWANPRHERAVRDRLRGEFPDLDVSISYDVAPEIREYERTSTTVANAFVRPMVRRYLGRLRGEIEALGARPQLQVMLSSAGVTSFEKAAEIPVHLIESGAAGGATAASYWGGLAGMDRIVAFDMGGTTAKITLIDGGRPAVVNDLEVARLHRFKRGSGLPMKTPSIDVIEIGAGGGSIARFDALGLLQIGPESAGARPGPACYGRGGTAATVTDADLVLGYLDADYFLGGTMRLDRDLAERALAEIAQPLGVTAFEAAARIRATVDDSMARALRVHAAERGRDVRGSTLVTFGGAGPVHAFEIARLLRINRILCPFAAGVASALGFVVAPRVADLVRSHVGRLGALDWAHVNGLFRDMETEGREIVARGAGQDATIRYERSVEMRYAGQSHEIRVDLPVRSYSGRDAAAFARRFHAAYRRRFGHALPAGNIETLSWRCRVSVPSPVADTQLTYTRAKVGAQAEARSRTVFFPSAREALTCAVYNRDALEIGARFHGPALVEEPETTLAIGPGAVARVDGFRNLVIELEAEPAQASP